MKSNKEKLKEFMIWKSKVVDSVLLNCKPYMALEVYSHKDILDYENNWTEENAKYALHTLYDNIIMLSDYQDYFGLNNDTCPECVLNNHQTTGCVNTCRYGKNNGFCIPYSSDDANRVTNNKYYEITKQLIRNEIDYSSIFLKKDIISVLEQIINE